MKLNLEQIRSITCGAARVWEEEDGLHFSRFTEEQDKQYQIRDEGYYLRALTSSGIRFSFRTESKKLGIKGTVYKGGSRSLFSFELKINGEKVDTIQNFNEKDLPVGYTSISYPLDPIQKEFSLGDGEKEVILYFPWSVKVVLQEVTLDDGATLIPVKPEKKILCFGDSITQGYDALYPTNKYATVLSELLGAEEYNKAIGGEIFWAELGAMSDPIEPDYILVAYGTNNWSKVSRENSEKNCIGFYQNLSRNYPNAKIFALTPIWRKDEQKEQEFGKFFEVEEMIRNATDGLENVSVIRGYDLVPHDEKWFADLRLHPNDQGFAHYSENLYKEIKSLIE